MFEPVPQVLRNVRFNGGAPLEDASVMAAIKDGENRLGDLGRILIRKSGTEPLIRVMAESDDQALVDAVVSQIVVEIEKVV
jgi:phosphoglucosamine mutase